MIRDLFFLLIIILNILFSLFFKEIEISNTEKIIIRPGMKLDEITENLYEKEKLLPIKYFLRYG